MNRMLNQNQRLLKRYIQIGDLYATKLSVLWQFVLNQRAQSFVEEEERPEGIKVVYMVLLTSFICTRKYIWLICPIHCRLRLLRWYHGLPNGAFWFRCNSVRHQVVGRHLWTFHMQTFNWCVQQQWRIHEYHGALFRCEKVWKYLWVLMSRSYCIMLLWWSVCSLRDLTDGQLYQVRLCILFWRAL